MTTPPDGQPGPGLYEIRSGRTQVNPDGTGEMTTTVRRKEPKRRKEPRPPGVWLIGWATWLLALLAGGVLAVSYAAQFVYIYAVRHQIIASNIESGMWDLGMVIFSMLALGLSWVGKPARTERALILACAAGSALMNYAASDVTSPRSVLVYVAPPLFLAVCVDRVVAVIRRYVLGADEGSPWAPLGRVLLAVARLAGTITLYALRLLLDMRATTRGLRRMVLNAAPLPAEPGEQDTIRPIAAPGSKKAQLLALYLKHKDRGDRSAVSRVATELAPQAGLQPGTARTYLYDYLDGIAS